MRGATGATAITMSFNALADPFGLDPRWLNRIADRIDDRLPKGVRAPRLERWHGRWVAPEPRTLSALGPSIAD